MSPRHMVRVFLVVWAVLLLAMVLIAMVRSDRAQAAWAAWESAARRTEVLHAQALQQQTQADYAAHVQAICGPETWFVTRPDGARLCATKRGRLTGRQLAGATP